MSPTATSPATTSSSPTSPVPVSSPVQTSPGPTSPPAANEAALKKTDAGVKKPTQKKKTKNAGFKTSQKAKLALQKMHAFFKAHRDDDGCRNLSHPERQKVLGKLWKASPENPKNNTQI